MIIAAATPDQAGVHEYYGILQNYNTPLRKSCSVHRTASGREPRRWIAPNQESGSKLPVALRAKDMKKIISHEGCKSGKESLQLLAILHEVVKGKGRETP